METTLQAIDRAAHCAAIRALAKARAAFPPIPKDAVVDFPGRGGRVSFRYATLDAIHKAVTPALCAEGLVLVTVPSDTHITVQLHHAEGGLIEASLPLPTEIDIKELGGQITYRRRYLTTSLLGIVADEDLDALATNPEPGARKAAPKGRKSARKGNSTGAQAAALVGVPPQSKDDAIAERIVKGYKALGLSRDERDKLRKEFGTGQNLLDKLRQMHEERKAAQAQTQAQASGTCVGCGCELDPRAETDTCMACAGAEREPGDEEPEDAGDGPQRADGPMA